MAKVSGKVVYKDGTVPKGAVCIVHFEPTENSTAEKKKGGTGGIEPDGSFVVSTNEPGDGVFPGTYNVSFTVAKDVVHQESLIQKQYTNSMQTPYKDITVDDDKDDFKFEIEPLPGVAGAPASP